MAFRKNLAGRTVRVLLLGLFVWGGCRPDGPDLRATLSRYRDRMLADRAQTVDESPKTGAGTIQLRLGDPPIVVPVAAQSTLPARQVLMTQPAATTQPAPAQVLAEIPDPVDAERFFEQRAEALAKRATAREVRIYRRVIAGALEYLQGVHRPDQVRLSLAECVQRALEHSYVIRIEAHNPAISQTQLVEAEAAFDAEFFLDLTKANLDEATISQLFSGQSDALTMEGGIRKLLPTGMQVSTSVRGQRVDTDNQFATLNPAYRSNLIISFRQPLLRGFGLDVNRAQINIRRAERDIAYETFLQRVRDTLLDVETAYWRLVQSRRLAAILAQAVAQNRVTYEDMKARAAFDANASQVQNSLARFKSREVDFREAVKGVRDAEDALRNLLNDPQLMLSSASEIIPTETPFIAPLVLDQFAEVRTALESRSEIRQGKRAIEQARIGTQAAKNQTMPQLDVTFRYEVQGVGVSFDTGFDNMTTNRFGSYTITVNFSYPFGNRARRAAHRRAELAESRAVIALHRATDGVVQEVNTVVRDMMVRLSQFPPQFDSVRAAERNLRTLEARAIDITPNYLQTQLSAVEQLTDSRNRLLSVVIDYNIAVIRLEKAKGTLLDYNNVIVTDAPPGR